MNEVTSKRGILIVISGFSGAGKGTIVKKLLSNYQRYALSISMTTRSPREGEVNGREYFFATKEEFEKKIEDNGFLEYARYCDHYYGTPKDYVIEQIEAGKDVILEIDIQGALQIQRDFQDAVLLFVTPPNAQELQRRLLSRQTEDVEVVKKRLLRASEEAEGMNAYDYILINDDIEECVKETHSVITAAHNTPARVEGFINHIREELKVFSKGE